MMFLSHEFIRSAFFVFVYSNSFAVVGSSESHGTWVQFCLFLNPFKQIHFLVIPIRVLRVEKALWALFDSSEFQIVDLFFVCFSKLKFASMTATFLKSWKSSVCNSSSILLFTIAASFVVLTLRIFDFPEWMCRPIDLDNLSNYDVFSCICICVCDKRAKSSAKSRSSNCVHSVHCIPFRLPEEASFINQSVVRINRKGDRIHPCLTQVLM